MSIVYKRVKYVHTAMVDSLVTPNIVIPIVLEYLQPQSVVDMGCGIGRWLLAFKNHGVPEVLGLDGEWNNPKFRSEYLNESEFRYHNLEKPVALPKVYDLVLCLEVAEHVSPQNADGLVQSLVSAGKVILFSAAPPGQGGFNHINEQFPTYWEEKFKKHGLVFYDVIRPRIWNNDKIQYYHRQNIFLIAPPNFAEQSTSMLRNVIHPEMYLMKMAYINRWNTGVRQFIPHVVANVMIKFINAIKFRYAKSKYD